MVDAIVPATDTALCERAADALGVRDQWPVQREAFSQWVIEDAFCNERPDFASVGVTLTGDVPAYVRAKLRLLNGAHSSLAYLGLLLGHASVGDAMNDPALAAFVRRLMMEDIRPTLISPPGMDLAAYIESILQRFRNPTIRHELAQIAWDGSQKLPFRLFGTILDHLRSGHPIERLCLPVAAWMHFVRRRAQAGETLVDPLAPELLRIGRACANEVAHDLPLFLALDTVFPPALTGDRRFVDAMAQAYDCLRVKPECLAQVLRETDVALR
jgi:fructuronate reductase